MTTYEITDNKSGKTYEISGDREPTELEVQDLIDSTLPKPSIEERVVANTLHTSDDARRKSYLRALGKNPNEEGRSWNPRELLADTLETGIGQGAKFVGQTAGEIGGAGIGALTTPVTGPVGPTAGFIVGGAGGRSLVQKGAEDYASMRGMPIEKSRVGQEAIAGGITSGIGKGISSVGGALAKTTVGKKFEEFMLTNLTRMSRPMQEWIEARGWTNVSNIAKTPKEAFTKLYDKAYGSIKTLFGKQDVLGEAITTAKNDLLFPAGNKPAMEGLGKQVADTVMKYRPNILKSEADAMLTASSVLERLGGDVIEQAPTRLEILAAIKSGKIPAEAVDKYMSMSREALEKQYSQALDTVVKLGRKAKVGQSTSLGSLSKDVNGLINQRVTNTTPYAEITSKLDELGEVLSEKNLKDPTKRDAAMKWLNENLFNEESIASNKAFKDTLSQYLGPEVVDNIKDLAAAHFLRSPQLLASFGKLTGVGLVGSGVGALSGYLTGGGNERAKEWAAIGGKIGLASALPYASPALAGMAHRFTEKVGPAVFNRSAIEALSQSPKLFSAPIASMIKDVESRMGLQVSEEDMKILKSQKK